MTGKKRVGYNPLESVIKDTRTEKRKDKTIKRKKDISISSQKEDLIRKAVKDGKMKNVYINSNGEVMTRILIHMPLALAESLREGAFNSIPRRTLSDFVREKLKESI